VPRHVRGRCKGRREFSTSSSRVELLLSLARESGSPYKEGKGELLRTLGAQTLGPMGLDHVGGRNYFGETQAHSWGTRTVVAENVSSAGGRGSKIVKTEYFKREQDAESSEGGKDRSRDV